MDIKSKIDELVERFYQCMPFEDVKLTSCDENKGLIKNMETLSAIQCAIICVEREIELLKQLRKPEYTTFVTDYKKGTALDGYEYIEEKESVLNELKKRV